MTTAALPPANAPLLGQAVQAAYLAFQGSSYPPIPGWTCVASVTGWDEIVWKLGKEELFALLFQSADKTQYLLAIRGTNSDTDLFDDAWFETVPFVAHGGTNPPAPVVAAGFYGVYADIGSMAASMQSQLFALVAQHGITELFITGHSLGAAIAQLFAFDMAISAPTVQITTLTFAAPKVGLEDWAGDYAASVSSVSIANQYDVVPSIPDLPNYQTVGTLYAVAFERSTTGWNPADDILIRHEMDNYQTVVTNILSTSTAPWLGTFADGVFPVTDESFAPSDAGAAVVAEVLAARRQKVRAAPVDGHVAGADGGAA
jgi:triacylglycerol lipase